MKMLLNWAAIIILINTIFGFQPSYSIPQEMDLKRNVDISDTTTSSLPDLDVAYIERTPRYNYDSNKNKPAQGDHIIFKCKVANRGEYSTGSFNYAWYIDGALVLNSTYPNLNPNEEIIFNLDWIWQTGFHKVRCIVDESNLIREISEQNNLIEDQTNALAVGFYVEKSVYDWFNQHQIDLGIGSVSWDDWAQRQLHFWNKMFADSISPLTPNGIIDRVRLDKVLVVPDGYFEDCGNWPQNEDKTLDIFWGFPSELVGVDNGRGCPPLNYYIDNPQFQNIDQAPLHEMSHARYLIDLYGLNVFVNNARLASSIDEYSSTLPINRNIEFESLYPLPAYLAVDGELIICQTKETSFFTNCTRGAEGTNPKPHDTGALVSLATVRIQDGQGNLVQGSTSMLNVGTFKDFIYKDRYPDDFMDGGLWSEKPVYKQYSAYAWNRIAGERPKCGNTNAPCNIGEYLNDLPMHNKLEVIDTDGNPVIGAQIEVYRAKPFPIWYGRIFLNNPDLTFTTDSAGLVDLGRNPFGDGDSITHTFGFSNAIVLFKVSYNDLFRYRFFEITEANEAYWFGNKDSALYKITLPSTREVDTYVNAPPLIGVDPSGIAAIPVEVGNYGMKVASSIILTATLDSNITFSSATPYPYRITGNQIIWTLPDIAYATKEKITLWVGSHDAPYGTRYPIIWNLSSTGPEDNSTNNSAESNVMISHLEFVPIIRK